MSNANDWRNAVNAIRERDRLFSEWNAQSIIFPAEKWNSSKRNASVFSFRSVFMIICSVYLVIPAILVVPYVVNLYIKRTKMKKLIVEQQQIISGYLPVKVKEDKFFEILRTNEGKTLVENGLIFYMENPSI